MTRLSDWTPRRFYWAALLIGLTYVFVTPVFTAPDEVAHFWRAVAVGRGAVAPASTPRPVPVTVDDSRRVLAWHATSTLDRTGSYGFEDLAVTSRLTWAGEERPVGVVPLYTPVAYLPQAFISAMSDRARVRPLVLFYAGRLANLSVWLLVIALAIRIAPACAPVFAMVALLPMTLYLFSSWSADAAAIALAMLFVALVVRGAGTREPIGRGETAAIAAAALLLTLCKPPYALLVLLAAFIPMARFRSRRHAALAFALIGVAAVAGTATSSMWFDAAYFNMRPGLPIDPAAQLQCIRHDPSRFAGVVLSDIARHGHFYIEQAVGRFAHNEIKLHPLAVRLGWIALAAVALTTAVGLSRAFRVAAIAIAVVVLIGIVASQYLIWSVVCGDAVEGVQGRYFLPILPLLMLGLGGILRRRIPAVAILAVAVVINGSAIATLLLRYW